MGVTDNPCEKASHTRRGRWLSLTAWVAAAVTACVPAGCSSWSVATAAGKWESSRPERPLVLPRRTPRRELVVPILMYHRIGVPSPGAPSMTRRLTVHPADFARQMRWLERNGYRTVTQRELFEALFRGRRLGRKPIVRAGRRTATVSFLPGGSCTRSSAAGSRSGRTPSRTLI
jgi:hypothetical protein